MALRLPWPEWYPAAPRIATRKIAKRPSALRWRRRQYCIREVIQSASSRARSLAIPDLTSPDRLHPHLPIAAVHQALLTLPAIPILLIRILRQIAQIVRLNIIAVHHMLPGRRPRAPRSRTPQAPAQAAPVALVAAASALHAQARLQARQPVRGDAVDLAVAATRLVAGAVALADAELFAVGVLARQIEQVDAGEDGQEAAEEGDRVACVDGVEALEEDEGGDEGEGGEGYVVEGVDAGRNCQCLVSRATLALQLTYLWRIG